LDHSAPEPVTGGLRLAGGHLCAAVPDKAAGVTAARRRHGHVRGAGRPDRLSMPEPPDVTQGKVKRPDPATGLASSHQTEPGQASACPPACCGNGDLTGQGIRVCKCLRTVPRCRGVRRGAAPVRICRASTRRCARRQGCRRQAGPQGGAGE
jgi:hypothetical protein